MDKYVKKYFQITYYSVFYSYWDGDSLFRTRGKDKR